MNILHRYTLQTLKRNKSRTLVTIVGIILSLSMLTAVTVLISSCQAFLTRCAVEEKGNWHGVIYSDRRDFAFNFSDREQALGVETGFVLQRIGYHLRPESRNSYKPYIYVAGADRGYFENMPVKLTAGRLPENTGEIILPDHMEANGGMTFEIGQQLQMDLSVRCNVDGRLLWQDTDYLMSETTHFIRSREYTVVGFYEKMPSESWSTPGFTALTVFSPQETGPVEVYFRADDVSRASDILYSAIEMTGDTDATGRINLDLLRFTGAGLQTGHNSRLYQLASVLMLIIILASVCLIYNSFSISVNERIKQFGLLSSIGATAKQLRGAVLYEGLVLCGVGVPVGIACGIAGIGLTLKIIDAEWISSSLQRVSITGTSPEVPFEMVITPAAIAVAAALGLATVLVSAGLPAAKAVSLSTIDALRQTYDTHIGPRDVGRAGERGRIEYRLAARNFRRSRSRYRTTVVSLVVSITLFVSTFMVVDSMTKDIRSGVTDIDYDLIYYYNSYNDLPLEDRYRQLRMADGVTESGYFVTFRDYVTVAKMYLENPEIAGEDSRIMMTILFVDDENFDSWLTENGVDPAPFYNPAAPQGATTNIYRSYDIGSGIYTDCRVLEKSGAPAFMKVYEADFHIVPACSNMPYGVRDAASAMPVVFPFSMMKAVIGNAGYNAGMINCRLAFSSDNPRHTQKNMEDMLGQAKYNIYNARADYQQMVAVVSLIKVFAYGFIGLITLIAIANVINTISTNISLRRKEFAVLKSSGMSEKGFARMMKAECMIYGVRSIAAGIPAALALSAAIWQVVSRYDGSPFPLFTVAAAGAAASLAVLAVVYLTAIWAISRLKKEKLLDVLKNENI